MASMIALVDVSMRLPAGGHVITVLDRITLHIPQGQKAAIVGPSGSGKSTLLGLMAALDLPTSGSIVVMGMELSRLSENAAADFRRRTIGYVFQSFHLIPTLTARENVMLPLELQGRPHAGDRAEELLAKLGLNDRQHHYPAQLFGGEQPRVALARAFAPCPPVLLADEPTGNLDSSTGRHVIELMLELNRQHGSTLVLVTHDPALANFADRIVTLWDGRIVSDEPRG